MRRFEYVAAVGMLLLAACAGGEKKEVRPPAVAAESAGAASGPVQGSKAVAADAGERPAVVFLGTSLTAAYGLDADSAFSAQVQRLIDARKLRFRVINGGVTGETSAGLLQRLDWVLQQPAALIVVETGANDGLRGQPVEGTKATIGQILDRIRAERPDARVVLVQMEAPTNLGADYTRAFHAMFPALAASHGVALMPFLLDSVAGQPTLNQADGIHPNYAGERIVTANVWRTVGPILDSIARGGAAQAR